jgi:hypothetical protein
MRTLWSVLAASTPMKWGIGIGMAVKAAAEVELQRVDRHRQVAAGARRGSHRGEFDAAGEGGAQLGLQRSLCNQQGRRIQPATPAVESVKVSPLPSALASGVPALIRCLS